MTVTATFDPNSGGSLAVRSDAAGDSVSVTDDGTGRIVVDGGAIPIQGGVPTTANTRVIVMAGNEGNDFLSLGDVGGSLEQSAMLGGTGNDTLVGGSVPDIMFGGADNDLILGRDDNDILVGEEGFDTLSGGEGNDILFGGGGNDQIFGGGGNDSVGYAFGEGNDLIEGGDGVDTLIVRGSAGTEAIIISATGGRVRVEDGPASFRLDIGTTEIIRIDGDSGNDLVFTSGNLASLIRLEIDGGDGNDILFGGNGADVIMGSRGSDTVSGLGGDDRMIWNSGEGNDSLDGGSGFDTAELNGGAAADVFAIRAAGDRVRADDAGKSFALDIGQTESIVVNAQEGDDFLFTDGDLAGLVRLTVDAGAGNDTVLGGTSDDVYIGGTGNDSIFGRAGDDRMIWRAGDGNDVLDGGSGIDTAEIGGGSGADTFAISTVGGRIRLDGTAPAAFSLDIDSTEKLVIDAGGGNDLVSVTGGLETVASLTVDGGAGNDTIGGADGADLLRGGDGNDALSGLSDSDTLDGGLGADTMQGGFGADVYIVDDAGDRVIEVASGGRDLVKSTVSFTLGTSVDNLTLLGGEDLTGIGNSGRNVMTGNDGDNLLDGKAAADNMAGGKGDDTYMVDNDRDVVTEAADSGIDTVRSSVSLTLSANVENLVLTGTGKTGGTGNGLDNLLTGNGASNVLDGGDGADTLVGGGGNDSLTGGAGGDRFAFSLAASTGTDVILDFDRTADRLSFGDLLDGGTPGLDLDDLNAAISGVADGGAGGDVTVAFANGATLVFAGLGTGAVDSIDDLVADPATQIIL